ncbi:MAG: hypothetical protein AB1791_02850 [Chloroflexota bacterium]
MVTRYRFLLLFLAFSLILSACEGASGVTYGELTQEIWIGVGDLWKVELTWSFNQSERQMLQPSIESQLQQRCQRAVEQRISCDWSQHENLDGGLTYSITAIGSGLDKLNLAAFDGKASLARDERNHVQLRLDQPLIPSLRAYKLTVRGREIISSNATTETRESATWRSLGPIQVEMISGGNLPELLVVIATLYPWYLAGGLALVVLLGLGWVLWRRSKSGVPSKSKWTE